MKTKHEYESESQKLGHMIDVFLGRFMVILSIVMLTYVHVRGCF